MPDDGEVEEVAILNDGYDEVVGGDEITVNHEVKIPRCFVFDHRSIFIMNDEATVCDVVFFATKTL